MEEAGSKVNHRRKKGDRSPGIMHCDLVAFEASADGHKYCLVAAVTIQVNRAQEGCCMCSGSSQGSTNYVW